MLKLKLLYEVEITDVACLRVYLIVYVCLLIYICVCVRVFMFVRMCGVFMYL